MPFLILVNRLIRKKLVSSPFVSIVATETNDNTETNYADFFLSHRPFNLLIESQIQVLISSKLLLCTLIC